jgi:predicted dehydrogenase
LPKDLKLYDEHVADLGRYAGGIFFEMGGHMVDMAVTLLGRPRRVTPFLRHHHQHGGDFIDHGVAVLEFPRAFAILEVPALEIAPEARRFEVYGTKGACVIPHLGSGHLANNAVQPVEVYRAGADDWERLAPPAATLQIADLREFAAVVRGQKQPEYTPEHDRIVHETLLAASGML